MVLILLWNTPRRRLDFSLVCFIVVLLCEMAHAHTAGLMVQKHRWPNVWGDLYGEHECSDPHHLNGREGNEMQWNEIQTKWNEM